MMGDNADKRKALFSACESGDKHALTKLIKSEKLNPSSYDMINDQGKTLLHIACGFGHIDIVRMLIEIYGCSPNVVDNTGSIPFHDACYYDQVLIVDYLLHAVAEPSKCLQIVDLNGNTAFHKANQSGSSQVIKYILYIIFCEKLPPKLSLDMDYEFQSSRTSNLRYFFVPNKVGDTPPATACRHGHLSIIKLYMHCNDHFPEKMFENMSYLLYITSQCGQYEIVCYLENRIKIFYRNPEELYRPVSKAIKSRCLHRMHHIYPDTTYYVPGYHVDDDYYDHYNDSFPVPIIVRPNQHYRRWNILIKQYEGSTVNEILVYMPLLRGDHQSVVDFHVLKAGQHCSPDELKFNICHFSCIANDIDLLNLYFCKSLIKGGISLLHTACEWGSETAVEYLITKGDCDLNVCNSFGETPLHTACRHGRVQIVELLLKHCPSTINNRSNMNETPLHVACLHSDVTLAILILDKQPSDIDFPDIYGDTPLLNACRVGNVEVVKLLVGKGCDPLYVNKNSMEMSIHIACNMQRLDILQVLVKDCNAKVDARNCFGETPLCIAMNFSCMDVVHFMVSKQLCDASLCLKDKHQPHGKIKETGDNAVHLACKLNDMQLLQLLLNHCPVHITNNEGNTPYHIAAKDGCISLMKCLISSGNYPLDHFLNKSGNSALHLACESGSLKVVQLLLDHGCSVSLQNLNGDTPIHVACQKKYSHLVKCLLEKCSGNLDCHTNILNETFLHVASKKMDIDTVKILLDYCSTTCQDSNGDTPIHIACRANMQSLIACLLNKTESTFPFVNKKGQTYLHSACNDHAKLNVIKTIIESGYKTLGNHPDNNGDTPLHRICHSTSLHEEIIEYLVMNDCCDPHIFNNDGLSPLYYTLGMDKLNFLKHAVSSKLCDPNRPLKSGSPLLHCLVILAAQTYQVEYLRQHRFLSEFDEDIRYTSQYYRGSTISPIIDENSPIVEVFIFLTQFDKKVIDFNATDKEGNTVLHLACQSNQYKIIEVLLSTESDIVRQSISHRNHNKKTPIQLTSDYRIIRLLISYGANPEDVYRRFAQILDRSKEEQPLEPAVKVIVLGNSTAGKTTLVKALKSNRDVMTVKGSTAGIETSDYNSKEFGRVTFHDFAGQPEFESSHSAFLERCSSSVQPPIFILVVNASQREYIERRIHNWLSFIQNHCTHTETPPHVIVIGSHSDKLLDSERSHVHNTYTKAIESFKSSDFECFKPVLLDCRRGQSKGMKRLQRRLKDSCLSLKKFVELDCRCHILFANLAKWFPKEAVVTVKELQERIKLGKSIESQSEHPMMGASNVCYGYQGEWRTRSQYHYSSYAYYPAYSSEVLLPISTDPLLSLLKSLHTGGHVLLLEGVEDSWIVMNQDALFKTVNGILFAPKDFKQHVKLDNNTGVVPLSKLQSLFPQLDFKMVKEFIVYYEFCQRIEDAETLQLIHGSSDLPIESEELSARIYYFFPGYVMSEKPATLWDTPEDLPYAYSCGWMLQCQTKQCFETRFLHVLLLRLTFAFVASSSESALLNRKCDIWKNGIHWGTRHGVEVMVEIIEEKTIALVLVRCYKGQELEAVKLRTAVLKKVWEAKKEFCPRVNTIEYLVHPSEVAGFCSQGYTHKISITEVTQTIIEGLPFVICPPNNKPLPLDTLLYYEPYSRMDENHLKMFFAKEKANSSISPDTLYTLSNFLHPVYQHLVKVLKIPPSELGYHQEKWRDHPVQMLHHLFESWTSRREQPTFGTLRSEFDQYSIFFGRDPLDPELRKSIVANESTEETLRCSE